MVHFENGLLIRKGFEDEIGCVGSEHCSWDGSYIDRLKAAGEVV